jgi:effector-binding domain-containing protein
VRWERKKYLDANLAGGTNFAYNRTYVLNKKEKIMDYKCEIKELQAQPVLSIRARCAVQELPKLLGISFGAIAQHLGSLGENPAGAPFVAYYNMEMQNLDVEIGFPVAHSFSDQGNIQPNQIFGGKFATCLFVGPYSDVGPAYDALTQFVKAQGCEATGAAYEFYLNDPQTVQPAELQTQIYFPLK